MKNEIFEIARKGLTDIAIVCDGAHQDDHMGFNAVDSSTGKSLIAKTFWSNKDKIKALKLFNKYRKQHGINFSYENDIKPILDELKETDRLITINKNVAVISFAYDSDLVRLVKTTGSKFDPSQKIWIKELKVSDDLSNIEKFAKENNFELEVFEKFIAPVQVQKVAKLETEKFEGKLLVDNKKIVITFDYSPNKVTELKKINVSKKYNPDNRSWNINTSDLDNTVIHELVEYANRNKIEIDNNLYSFVKTDKIAKVVTLEELKTRYPFAMDYQLEGVKYHIEVQKAYNGDTMGLGKSVQTLMTLDYTEQLPALIIAPNSLKYNWKKEVQKFIPDRTCYVISAKDKIIPTGYDIYVINYDIVEKKLEQLKTFDFKFIACDESHLLKNKDTKRFKAVYSLVNELQIENRVLLSGTCITNRPKELVSQLKLLGVLNKIVDKEWNFFMRYCDATQTAFGWDLNGASNLKELNEKLSNTCYIRREKEQVLKQLPAKQKTTVELEIDNRKEYNQALENLTEYLSELRGEEVNLQAEQLVQIEILKQIVVKGKIQCSIEWIQNVLDNDEKLVVFAHHKTTIKALQEAFPDSLTIDGSTEAEQRQKIVDQFQNDPNKKLIICSIKSASVGLTLTASSNVAFLELTWTPADLDQAEDRCHRIGQLNNVNVYYLLGKDTIEDLKIMPLIESKRNIFNAAARGENVAKKDLKTSLVNDFIKSLLKDQKKKVLSGK